MDGVEPGFMFQVTQILGPPGEVGIEADHGRTFGKERVDEVRADEPRAARDQGGC
jgi:hypothetical protein